jgi:hypothetical protein
MANQADEPDGKNDAVFRKGHASLKNIRPAGYPQSFALNSNLDIKTFYRYSVIATNGGDIMATQTKRATIYFDPNLHKALRLKSVETSRSVSELVNQAVREALSDDAEDLLAFEERADETLISYEEMVKRLKKDGRI